ncbi:hypothetical protein IQ07DRAFT_643614 [Pyrenochaeta sp. DS3sAY3a]|nr:hypothetical protein IQ07DRAFT_643614 [Pyrenochaeta sp. DS3sAY3a]
MATMMPPPGVSQKATPVKVHVPIKKDADTIMHIPSKEETATRIEILIAMTYGDPKAADAMVQTYSQKVCRPFVEAMHQALPRELRDMVYNYLFNVERLRVGNARRRLKKIVKDQWKRPTRPNRLSWIWFLNAAFAGDNPRREMLELLYARVFAILDYPCTILDSLHRLGTFDESGCGLLPIHFVRHLRVRLVVGTWWTGKLRDPLYWSNKSGLLSWKSCFAILRQVENKRYFRMRIIIANPGRISTKHVGHFLEVFRPLYCELTTAGAHIYLQLDVCYSGIDSLIDLCQLYEQRKAKWSAILKTMIREKGVEWNRANAVRPWMPKWVSKWDEEGDKAFDEAMESRLISYEE